MSAPPPPPPPPSSSSDPGRAIELAPQQPSGSIRGRSIQALAGEDGVQLPSHHPLPIHRKLQASLGAEYGLLPLGGIASLSAYHAEEDRGPPAEQEVEEAEAEVEEVVEATTETLPPLPPTPPRGSTAAFAAAAAAAALAAEGHDEETGLMPPAPPPPLYPPSPAPSVLSVLYHPATAAAFVQPHLNAKAAAAGATAKKRQLGTIHVFLTR